MMDDPLKRTAALRQQSSGRCLRSALRQSRLRRRACRLRLENHQRGSRRHENHHRILPHGSHPPHHHGRLRLHRNRRHNPPPPHHPPPPPPPCPAADVMVLSAMKAVPAIKLNIRLIFIFPHSPHSAS